MIPVNRPVLGARERELLAECIDTGWISSEGPFVERFEAAAAARFGRAFGVAVSSGSAALDVAVAALGIGPGDEVILPAFTIISCAQAVVRAGATPVLVDAAPDTWNMDVERIKERITSRTRAVMAVHIYGLPVDMDAVCALARTHGLAVIEDAAEAIGQTVRGRPCGGFGDLSVLSFYPNKHVTTGEGGMVLTDDADLAERCRGFRNHCFQPGKRFVHDTLGWNYRMTNLQAALGVAQLERLEETLARKRRMGGCYREELAGIPGFRMQAENTPYAENLPWVVGLVLDDASAADAAEIMGRLADRGVGTRPFFWPIHEQPVFRRMGLFPGDRHPVSEGLARRGFYLPSGPGLTGGEIHAVARALRVVLSP